jgi:hypothetical protein
MEMKNKYFIKYITSYYSVKVKKLTAIEKNEPISNIDLQY